MGLIIDPVAILLSATGGQNKRVLILKTAENMGVRMAVQKERRARCLTCAASYVHAKTPLYAYTCSSIHLRPAIIAIDAGGGITAQAVVGNSTWTRPPRRPPYETCQVTWMG